MFTWKMGARDKRNKRKGGQEGMENKTTRLIHSTEELLKLRGLRTRTDQPPAHSHSHSTPLGLPLFEELHNQVTWFLFIPRSTYWRSLWAVPHRERNQMSAIPPSERLPIPLPHFSVLETTKPVFVQDFFYIIGRKEHTQFFFQASISGFLAQNHSVPSLLCWSHSLLPCWLYTSIPHIL